MKKIGILLREKDDYLSINKDIIDYLLEYDVSLIGIIITNDFNKTMNIVSICDGIILPGGNVENEEVIRLVKYLYDINKPTFGICLGMQDIAKAFVGSVEKLDTEFHNNINNYVHNINIKKDTLLYKILGTNHILVNSRHSYYVKDTNLNISAYSDDYIIEAIEDKNKKFFLGVQWHPEGLKKDINSKLLIDYFINMC